MRKLTRGAFILVMDKITRQSSFLASVIVLFREYFDDQRHPYTVEWDYVKIKCIKEQLFSFRMIQRNTATNIYNLSDDYVSRSDDYESRSISMGMQL